MAEIKVGGPLASAPNAQPEAPAASDKVWAVSDADARQYIQQFMSDFGKYVPGLTAPRLEKMLRDMTKQLASQDGDPATVTDKDMDALIRNCDKDGDPSTINRVELREMLKRLGLNPIYREVGVGMIEHGGMVPFRDGKASSADIKAAWRTYSSDMPAAGGVTIAPPKR